MKEKVEELIPQLERFKQNITTPIVEGDPEESDRRSGLAGYVPQLATAVITTNHNSSTFKHIEELSYKLLEKGAIPRFVDKGEDAKVVTKLIDQLREALNCYQVSDHHPSARV